MSVNNILPFFSQLKSIKFRTLWTDIKESIAGSNRDFTSDSIVSIAIVAAETTLTITAWYFFRKGRWKTGKSRKKSKKSLENIFFNITFDFIEWIKRVQC